MGLFATILDNNNVKRNRKKTRNHRICRFEEVEQRELLSASPYAPPDAIDFGIVYHDDYSPTETGQVEATQGDTFIVSWGGGAENTKLTRLIIDLSTVSGDYLYFNTDPNSPQGSNGAAWDFQIAADSDVKNCAFTLSENERKVTITFGENFSANKVLKFTVDVARRLPSGAIEPVVNGATFEGVSMSAIFEATNYADKTIVTNFLNDYNIPSNLKVPADDYSFPDESHRASTAGAIITGNEQTPLKGKISGYVYEDRNNNGIKDNGENGIPNASLSLWVWDNRLNQYVTTGKTAVTNGNGYYEFLDVDAFKRYQIRESQPTGYEDGKEAVGTIEGIPVGTLPTIDNDTIADIWMPANRIGENYNFGEIKSGLLSGYVYEDSNNNGIKDAGESGIPNARLFLWVWDAEQQQYVNTNKTATTNANGYYEFNNVEAFKRYQIRQTQPNEYEDGKEAVGTINGVNVGTLPGTDNDTISDVLMTFSGVGENYNFGEIKSGSLSGYVYHDKNDDGYWDNAGGEEALANITLSLWVWDAEQQQYVNTGKSTTTDDDGYYVFNNVGAFKTYQIRMTPEEGYIKGKKSVGKINGITNGILGTYTIKEIEMPFGGVGTVYNFALYKNGSISGKVVNDGGEPIPDAVVEVYDKDGNKVGETTTDENGHYEFPDLPPGEYWVIEYRDDEKYCGGTGEEGNLGGEYKKEDNSIRDIIINSGDEGTDYDFIANRRGELSGYVYLDVNKNGIFDADEPGLAGVKLELWVWDNALDMYRLTSRTAITDENGYYLFWGLCSGNRYQIREEQPDGCVQGWNSVGSLGGEETEQDVIGNIAMPPNGKGENYNFGELTPPIVLVKGSISGYVYLDKNKNDRRDVDEFGIRNVTIILEKLVNEVYVEIRRTTTNSSGYYIFEGMDPNETYRVREIKPEGYEDGARTIGSLSGQLFGNDSIQGIVVGEDQHGVDYDFGKVQPDVPIPLPGSISGYVYFDENQDGIRNDDELGIENVMILLEKLVGEQYVLVAYTQTAPNGHYVFNNLDPNETYRVVEIQPEVYKQGQNSVGSLGGSISGDTISGINLPEGGIGTDYNFGEWRPTVPPQPEPGSISGYVYFDENQDGIRNDVELGIENVMILLEKLVDGQYVLVAYTYTDSTGYYAFNDLDPNETYQLTEVQPENYKQGQNSVGSLGGTISGDTISGINLPEEGNGTNYNFGEWRSVDPPPPPPPPPPPSPKEIIPRIPITFPSMPRPSGGAGAWAAAGVPAWYPTSLADPLRTGFGGGAGPSNAFSWHLSVVNAGYPRSNGTTDGIAFGEHASNTTMILSDYEGNPPSGARYVSVAWTPLPMKQSSWYVRGKDGKIRKRFTFGPDGGIPVVGDFSGDGIANIAVYHDGNWYVDINGNAQWDEEDLWAQMGSSMDQPVVGDWDGDGKTDIGIFGSAWSGDIQIVKAKKPGLPSDLNANIASQPKNVPPDVSIDVSMNTVRAMKHSQSSGVRLDVIDHVFQYGNEGDKAFTGDFTGDGISTIGVYRNGQWYIDRTGSGKWDDSAVYINNADFGLGSEGIPVIGDFNGDGIDKIGLYVDGVWYLDTTGDFKFDTVVEFGEKGDHPVVGDFDGTGIAQLAVYRASTEESLYASVPEAVSGAAEGLVAEQYGGDDQVAESDQGLLKKHHGRSMSTPHTNAPLLRGR